MIIGGAEDKLGHRRILRRFVSLSGGNDAVIAVCATASSLGDEITDLYERVFYDLGAKEVLSVRPVNRAEAQALFVACTDFPVMTMIGQLEEELGKPVITSNQATFWAALRAAGLDDRSDGYGRLLREH